MRVKIPDSLKVKGYSCSVSRKGAVVSVQFVIDNQHAASEAICLMIKAFAVAWQCGEGDIVVVCKDKGKKT